MARNQEKAQSMMNRYLKGKQEEASGPKKLRPFLASECSDLHEADRWHHQIIREISRKVSEIQNAGLGEHRIRDLNDEINKLIREKGHWVRRIVELGGPDYSLTAQRVTDSEGKEMAGATGRGAGYRYFGAAKNLPGVKELFEKEGPRSVRRTRFDMHKAIDADYFGFRDEDDGILVKLEAPAEKVIRKRDGRDWPARRLACQAKRALFDSISENVAVRHAEIAAAIHTWQSTQIRDEWEAKEEERRRMVKSLRRTGKGQRKEDDAPQYVAYVPLPEQKEIELRVLAKKKHDLMAKYASDALIQQQEEAKQLLNVHE